MPSVLSLAQRHYLRVTARQNSAAGNTPEQSDAHRRMEAALWADRRALKDIKSLDRKIARKRDELPKYADYVAGIIDGGAGAQDEVLMTVMVWRFDVRDLDGGLAIADYAIRHDMQTPDRFARDTPSIVAEEVAEQVLAILDERRETDQDGTAPNQLVAWADRAQLLTESADIHDQVRAKLAKAIGYALRAAGDDRQALDHLTEALRLNQHVGVKKDIERLKRQLDKQTTAAGH